MKGYKIFNEQLMCRDFQYKVGETYEIKDKIVIGSNGFHFSPTLIDCTFFRTIAKSCRVCEVEALGEVVTEKRYRATQCCTNKIKIVRELLQDEIYSLLNFGVGNTNYFNVGDGNSGQWNIGERNSGNHNVGDDNYGDYNVGDSNEGDRNVGIQNYGRENIGAYNIGCFNIGDNNKSSSNIGNCNTGHNNVGNFNAGNGNIGDYNSGNNNIGNFNRGNGNRGIFNIGHDNIGDFNYGANNLGCFNTISNNVNSFFNKPVDLTMNEWHKSIAYRLFQTIKVPMKIDPKRMFIFNILNQWWSTLSDEQKTIVFNIPNFDIEVFKRATGIVLSAEDEQLFEKNKMNK